MPYDLIGFRNDTTPDINAENLNYMDNQIKLNETNNTNLQTFVDGAVQKNHGLNLYNKAANQNNKWYYTTGSTIVNPTTANGYVAQKILLDSGETKITLKPYFTGTTTAYVYKYYFTDDSGNILSSGSFSTFSSMGENGQTKDIPSGATILLMSIYNGVDYFANKNGKIMLTYGETAMPYEDYEVLYLLGGKRVVYERAVPFDTNYLADGAVTDEKTSFLTSGIGNNLFDPSKAIYPAWYYTTGTTIKNPTALSATYHYCAYAIEDVDQYEAITIKGNSENHSGVQVYVYYFTNSSDTIVASGNINHTNYVAGKTLTVPSGAKRLLLSIDYGEYLVTDPENNIIMVNAGDTPLPYEPFGYNYFIHGVPVSGLNDGSVTTNKLADGAVSTEKLQDGSVTPEKLSGAVFENVKLKCPKKIVAVVGDYLELFYKGMVNAVNVDYEMDISFSDNANRGKAWKRKYTWGPVAADVGDRTMTINMLNNAGDIIDTANISVKTVAAPTNPGTNKVVLCVGDSLTAGGQWPKELKRRLTGSGGTPAGYNLSNFTFIGTKEVDGTKFEGNGGWTWTSYETANSSNKYMWITTTHDKTQADQHSVYEASNGTQWYLETIETGQIKIIRTSGSAALPSTGTLTWVSGGDNHSDIVYTASEQAAGNPFWDEENNQNDFQKYATSQGVSSIDYCIILLGWNSTTDSESSIKNQANVFINRLQTQFPNCKVILLGLEVPAYDGIANNYGISWKYYDKLQAVWKMQNAYESIADDNNKVSYGPVAAEFDTEYNMQSSAMTVNRRNSETIMVQNNGVHPADSGYLQIADTALRALAGVM